MKKQKSDIDPYAVGGTTAKLNAIKRNNQTLELLDKLQDTIESLCGTWELGKPKANDLIYKDKEGGEIDQHEFWDNLHYFVDRNQDYLLRESQRIYESIKKQRVA